MSGADDTLRMILGEAINAEKMVIGMVKNQVGSRDDVLRTVEAAFAIGRIQGLAGHSEQVTVEMWQEAVMELKEI